MPLTRDAETIIVARGRMVVADDGRGVGKERPQGVDVAAHAQAIHPVAVAQAAEGLVVTDLRSADDHRADRDVDHTAEAVAAVAAGVAVAAEGPIVVDGGSQKRGGAAIDKEAAAEAVGAV